MLQPLHPLPTVKHSLNAHDLILIYRSIVLILWGDSERNGSKLFPRTTENGFFSICDKLSSNINNIAYSFAMSLINLSLFQKLFRSVWESRPNTFFQKQDRQMSTRSYREFIDLYITTYLILTRIYINFYQWQINSSLAFCCSGWQQAKKPTQPKQFTAFSNNLLLFHAIYWAHFNRNYDRRIYS